MQILINKNKADEVIRTAPAINGNDVVCKHNVRVELFDYGTPMGWGYDVRVRVFMDNKLLPFGAEHIHARVRPAWLPTDMTISAWNNAVQAALANPYTERGLEDRTKPIGQLVRGLTAAQIDSFFDSH